MSIEENDINWVADGEDASAEVLNRPGKELLSEINDALENIVPLEQSTGDSTTNAMSQKAVTDEFNRTSTSTVRGGLKTRLVDTTLYMSNNSNPA